jgi:hypothetical protein
VDAHHFPSSRKVVIPQPTKIQTSPTPFDYRPPSIVSLSPCDLWLFAFFPSTTADGLGCLWRRGEEVDHWAEKESFFFLRGADPVAASWVGGPREVSGIYSKVKLVNNCTFSPSGPQTPNKPPHVSPGGVRAFHTPTPHSSWSHRISK